MPFESQTPPSNIPGRIALTAEQELVWIRGLRQGDLGTYRSIFEHFTPALWRFACLTVPKDVAEDIVQDVMFDVWQRRTSIEIRGGLAAYLFRAVRHKTVTHHRHLRVVQRSEKAAKDEHPLGMGELPPIPDHALISADFQSALMGVFQQLPSTQREVLMLRWVQEMSYEQIASAFSISLSAAQQAGSRAQRTVRSLIGRFLDQSD